MAKIKTVTPKQAQTKAMEANAARTVPTEPTPEKMAEEERKAIEIAGGTYPEDIVDPDILEAMVAKKVQALEKAKTPKKKDDNRVRISGGTSKPRPCKSCGVTITSKDPRTKYCKECARKASEEASKAKAGRPPLNRAETEEKLRPFLRIGLNLKEACLEAELKYSTITDKVQEWEGFGDFIERHMNYAVIKAKKNVFGGLASTDEKARVDVSRWLLERRRPDEYGNRQQVDMKAEVTEKLDGTKREILEKLIRRRIGQGNQPE